MSNETKRKLILKKVIISVIFGVIGFFVNFHAVDFMQFTEFKVSILFGLFFPLLIALFWGWRYGLISALAGGCQTMWYLWYSDGYGIIYSVPVFTLWIVWHGYWADIRSTDERRWYHSMYIMELVFRIVIELGFFSIFRWLISLNPPFWDSTITNNNITWEWLSFVARKHLISSYVLLLLVDILLHIKPLRKIFGLKNKEGYIQTTYIVSISIIIGFLLWMIQSLMDYFVFFPDCESFLNIAFIKIPSVSLFNRNLFMFTSLIAGLIISRIYLRLKTKELLLIETEKRFHSFIDSSPDAIFVISSDVKIIYMNDKAREYFYDSDEMMGKSFFSYVAPGYLDSVRKDFLGKTRGPHSPYEIAMQTKSEQAIFFEIHSTDYSDQAGNNSGRIAILRDITQRIEREKIIREKTQFFQRIIETNPNCITIVNNAGEIIYANKNAEKVLGLTNRKIDNTIYNDPDWNISDFDGKELPSDQLPFNIVKRTKKNIYNVRHCIQIGDNELKYLKINAAPVLDDSNGFIYMIANIEDITEQTKIQKELEQYRSKLEQLVVERTSELEEKNETLHHYLKIFEKREFRINEMKQEIKDLKRQLNEKK